MSQSKTKYLITGGAGFVGSSIALYLKQKHPSAQVIALDNLKRRGSELSLPRLRAAGVDFVHGDVREITDLEQVGPVDCLSSAPRSQVYKRVTAKTRPTSPKPISTVLSIASNIYAGSVAEWFFSLPAECTQLSRCGNCL